MSDLIDRQAAIDAIEEYADRLQMVNWKENPGVPYKAYTLNWCINTIRDLPAAQPEVIRCKDCKYKQGSVCEYSAVYVHSNGFCNWGTRKGEEE